MFPLRLAAATFITIALLGCSRTEEKKSSALAAARAAFTTKLTKEYAGDSPPPEPPAGVLDLISYAGPLGAMAAYGSPDPGDGRRHPAIVWLVGGFGNGIDATAWTPGPAKNDQSAAGFRQAGILTMYPALRGGNNNPGRLEGGFGEVDDVLAAAAHLAGLGYVDPERIYLGGHSTGGTLALLVAETGTTRFRAIFSLGPVEAMAAYGPEMLPFDVKQPQETKLRAPIHWLDDVQRPTFVFEGTEQPGNFSSLVKLRDASQNPAIRFFPIARGNHFAIIAPLVDRIAQAINADTGANPQLAFDDLDTLFPPAPAR